MSETDLIPMFVYGTLRQGYGNHALLSGAEFVGKGRISNAYLLADGIPFLRKSDNSTDRVIGEVYMVDTIRLVRIDRLEGHPRWYKREIVPVELDNGEVIDAWAYFCPHNMGATTRITSGDYTDYRRQYIQ